MRSDDFKRADRLAKALLDRDHLDCQTQDAIRSDDTFVHLAVSHYNLRLAGRGADDVELCDDARQEVRDAAFDRLDAVLGGIEA